MIRLDNRAPESIEAVIRWCQADTFWQNNILSGAKLREQYDQLDLKRRQSDPGGNSRFEATLAEWNARYADDPE
jgi:hypothetical protein